MNHFKAMRLHQLLSKFKSVTQFRRKQKEAQNMDRAILRLPVEVLLLIIRDNLPRHTQFVLSQTCRALRYALVVSLNPEAGLSRHESLDFLACLARDMPAKWVCDVCVKLHNVAPGDALINCRSKSCPKWPVHVSYQLGCVLFTQHIQLALKYTRISNINIKYRRYRKQLLAPNHGTYSAANPKNSRVVGLQASSYPMIVDGRYLIKSVVCYSQVDAILVSRITIGHVRLCPHQNFDHKLDDAIARTTNWGNAGIRDIGHALYTTIGAAFRDPFTEVRSSCPYCRTDFSLEACSRYATFRVWQDLGCEASPLHPNWRSSLIFRPYHGQRGPVVSYDKPGTVRTLYETGQHGPFELPTSIGPS
ncbi:hypothetical protein EDB81DRAFT_850316 [Dactylonectria macrodidyma]|uniref:Uncharacterized protein n=1 Tax=Dactylonectria macrodidyma TaxID=307937 RepID=A0A9P9FSC4_9HYPO|nr:hypothetical protein EDB81DRAFT_850316 [Dactylonectria macrodidyma]